MDPVQIGVKEIYDLLSVLDSKLDGYISAQEPRLALLTYRLDQMEHRLDKTLSEVDSRVSKADDAIKARVEKSGDRQWMVYLTLLTSLLALLGAFIVPLFVTRGR